MRPAGRSLPTPGLEHQFNNIKSAQISNLSIAIRNIKEMSRAYFNLLQLSIKKKKTILLYSHTNCLLSSIMS